MVEFKHGDRVKVVLGGGITAYGEVTIVTEDKCKVILDDSDLDYWYWPKKDLEIVDKNDPENKLSIERSNKI